MDGVSKKISRNNPLITIPPLHTAYLFDDTGFSQKTRKTIEAVIHLIDRWSFYCNTNRMVTLITILQGDDKGRKGKIFGRQKI